MSNDRAQKCLRTSFTIYTRRHDESEKIHSKKLQTPKRPKCQNKLLSDLITLIDPTDRMLWRRDNQEKLLSLGSHSDTEDDSLLQMSHTPGLKPRMSQHTMNLSWLGEGFRAHKPLGLLQV